MAIKNRRTGLEDSERKATIVGASKELAPHPTPYKSEEGSMGDGSGIKRFQVGGRLKSTKWLIPCTQPADPSQATAGRIEQRGPKSAEHRGRQKRGITWVENRGQVPRALACAFRKDICALRHRPAWHRGRFWPRQQV